MKFSKLSIMFLVVTTATLFSGLKGPALPQESGKDPSPLWTQTAGPPGGSFDVIEISLHDSRILYAGANYGLFRSYDRGENWQKIEGIHLVGGAKELRVKAVVFDPRDSRVVYVAGTGGIFKSSDSGTTWENLTEGLDLSGVEAMAIDPSNPDTIYVATHATEAKSWLHKTNDAGTTWTDITSRLPHQAHLGTLSVVRHNEIYAGGGFQMGGKGNLFHSSDGGRSWEILDIGQGEDTFVSIIKVDPHDPDHIFIGFGDAYNRGRRLNELLLETKDGGAIWQPLIYRLDETGLAPRAMGMPRVGSLISDIEISRTHPGLIYYLSPLNRSLDGGRSWQPIENWGYADNFGVIEQNNIAIDPENENILYATLMGQGVAKSIDGGNSWNLANNGLVASTITNVVTDPKNPAVVYASGGDGSGTWKTADRGKTWEPLNKGGIDHPWVDELTISPHSSEVLFNIADIGRMYKTEDAGRTWRVFNNGFSFSSIYALAVHPENANIVYCMNNGAGMFRSEEGGEGWSYLLESPDYSYSIAIDPSDPSIIYSGYTKKVFEHASGVYRSRSAGERWEVVLEIPASLGVTSVAVDAQDPVRVYAASTGKEGTIYASSNKGESWEKLNEDFTFSTIHAMAIDPNDENTVWAAPWGGGLFKTENGAKTWIQIETPTVSIASVIVDSNDSNHILLGDRTHPRIYETLDQGGSWQRLVSLDEEKYYRIGAMVKHQGDLYFSAFKKTAGLISLLLNEPMSGTTFKLEKGRPLPMKGSPPRSVLSFSSREDELFAITHIKGVYLLEDGKWQDISSNLPPAGFNSVIAPKGAVYIAGGCDVDLKGNRRVGNDTLVNEIYQSQDKGVTWTPLLKNNPFGSAVKKIIQHPRRKKVFFAATGTGVYSSRDGGKSWKDQNRGLKFKNIGSMVLGKKSLYVGTLGGGVYRGKVSSRFSIDWDRSHGPRPEIYNIQVAAHPKDSNIIYATSFPGGVFKSSDRGKTWNEANFAMPSFEVLDPVRQGYYSLEIDPTDPNILYLGIYGKGVYKSYNGAGMWLPLYGSLGQNRDIMRKGITKIKVDPTNPKRVYLASDEGVYFSKDGGKSWSELNKGLIVKDIKTLAIAKNGKVYAGSKGYGVYTLDVGDERWHGPFEVTNAGVHWHVWDRPLYLYNALAINPTDPDIMHIGSFPSGFYKTTDGGRTWHETNIRFTNDGAFSLTFHPNDPSIIYAGTYNGVSKSEDGGRSWRKIDKGMPPEQWVFSIVIDPDSPNIIYAASKNGENKGKNSRPFYGVVMKSTDRGESWFEIMNGLDRNEEFYQLVMHPERCDVLFVSSWAGVYMTQDAGASWEAIDEGLDIAPGIVNNVANNLKIDAEGRYLYLGTGGRGVYRADLEKLGL